MLLNCWQSWSVPCVRELQNLQDIQKKENHDGPVMIAIKRGETTEHMQDICRKYKLTFSLAEDPYQRFACRFGVICWPTAVSINKDGIVDGAQFSVTPEPTCSSAGQSD